MKKPNIKGKRKTRAVTNPTEEKSDGTPSTASPKVHPIDYNWKIKMLGQELHDAQRLAKKATKQKSDGTASTDFVAESESSLKVINAQDIKWAVHERLFDVPTLAEVYGMMKSMRGKVGQLYPIILDKKQHLITGLSRTLALRIRGTEKSKRTALIMDLLKQGLCTKSTEVKIRDFEKLAYDGTTNASVSVFDFDSSKDHNRAQKIVIAENAVRKQHNQHAAIIKRFEFLLDNGFEYAPSVHGRGYNGSVWIVCRMS